MNRWLIVLALLAAPGAAAAQEGREGRMPRNDMPRERIEVAGKLVGVQGNVLAVKADDGKEYLVKMPERMENISVIGTAVPGALQRGMLVRFSSSFNERGQQQGEISQLTIFTPREEMQIGVVQESGFVNDNLFGEEGARPKPKLASYVVGGRLTAMKGNTIGVAAGTANIKATLSGNVQIDFNVTDIRYASPGDAVKIMGYYHAVKPGEVYANRLTVSVAKPLGAPADKPAEPGQEKPAEKEE